MTLPGAGRRRHDLAYLYFLAPGILALLTGASHWLPLDTATSGGLGLLVLVPLALLTIAGLPMSLSHAWRTRDDPVLGALALLTVALLAVLLVDTGPPLAKSLLWLACGLAAIAGVASWFGKRRRRFYPG